MFCGRGPENDASSEIFQPNAIYGRALPKDNLAGQQCCCIFSSLNSCRFVLEKLSLELFSAGWNVAAPFCVLYGEIHEPRTDVSNQTFQNIYCYDGRWSVRDVKMMLVIGKMNSVCGWGISFGSQDRREGRFL